jgi:hypothetical protein
MQSTRCRPGVFAAIEVHTMMPPLQGRVQNDCHVRPLGHADGRYFRRVVHNPDARVVARDQWDHCGRHASERFYVAETAMAGSN